MFVTEDILDCLNSHIDIKDYDKLKVVSRIYKLYFDLKPLIISRDYSNISNIRGCSVYILINILIKKVVNKYNYENNIIINKKIIKFENDFILLFKNKECDILYLIIELYYNCYNKCYDNITNMLCLFEEFCVKKINIYNFTYFVMPIISYIDDIQKEIIENDDSYYDTISEYIDISIHINLNIYLAIIIKQLNIILPSYYIYRIQNFELVLSDIQNNKLDEIINNNIEYDVDGNSFPEPYVKFIKKLCKRLYI